MPSSRRILPELPTEDALCAPPTAARARAAPRGGVGTLVSMLVGGGEWKVLADWMFYVFLVTGSAVEGGRGSRALMSRRKLAPLYAKYARKREARSLSAGEGRATIRWQREGACGREQPRGAAQGLRFE